MLRRFVQSDNETARGISGLLSPTCVATLAVSPFGDTRMYKSLFAPRLCKCGCKEEMNPNCLYIHGHNNRGKPMSKEQKAKIGKANHIALQGRRLTKRHREHISLANKGKPSWIKGKKHSEETRRKMSLAQMGRPGTTLGTHLSEEHKRKIGKASKAMHRNLIIKEKIRLANTGRKRTKDFRQHLSAVTKELWKDYKYRENHQVPVSKEAKQHISRALKQLWKNPKHREKMLKALFAGRTTRPTRPEKQLRSLLNKLFPGEYKYVGDGKVWIDGKNPDFINVNGQKKVIEMFGTYWHGREKTEMNNTEHRKQREAHFAKYGYQTLVVWEHYLQDIPKLRKKLQQFHVS